MENGSPELAQAIREKRWRELAELSPRDQANRALCVLAEKLSSAPTRMTEEDWRELRDLGFDDQACLETDHIVGIFNYPPKLADGFGLLLDAAIRQTSV